MPDDVFERLFPALRQVGFEITSPRDQRYNCVAWAAGDVTRWWWPAESPFAYWPPGADREESVASFIQAFAILGYERALSGDLEPQFEKVAIFASNDGIPTHMARQLRDGTWTSKLGSLEDITHPEVSGVEGADYGIVVVFLRRDRSFA
jgi:hypothetical protein